MTTNKTFERGGITYGEGKWGNEFDLTRDPTIGEFKRLFDGYADEFAKPYEDVGGRHNIKTAVRLINVDPDNDSDYSIVALELDQLMGCGCPCGIDILISEDDAEVRKQKWIDEGIRRAYDIVKFAAANTDHDLWAERLEDIADHILDRAPQLKMKWEEIHNLRAKNYQLESELKKIKGDKNR